jgi:hypothetical protein
VGESLPFLQHDRRTAVAMNSKLGQVSKRVQKMAEATDDIGWLALAVVRLEAIQQKQANQIAQLGSDLNELRRQIAGLDSAGSGGRSS